MKKIISLIAAVALVAATVVVSPAYAASIAVSAARVDDNTLTVTLTGLTGNIANTDVFNITVKTLDNATAVNISGSTAIHGDNGSFAESVYNVTGRTLTADGVAGAPSKVITLTSTGSFTTTEDYFVTVVVGSGSTQNALSFGAAIAIASTQNQVIVTATVEPILTFALGGNSVALGTLSASATANGSHTMTASTNADSGYVITVSGNTLTHSNNTDVITAIGAGGASVIGTEQFGINLVDNATPNIGAAAAGGTGAATGNFSIADTFAFNAGAANTIANSVTAPSGATTYTVSYIANIAALTDAGDYSTTLTYTITPTF